MALFKRRRQPMRCVNCGVAEFDWPRFFTDEEYQRLRCQNGAYHAFFDVGNIDGRALIAISQMCCDGGKA